MTALRWELIDNDKIFQRLGNDLFVFEIGKPGYIPSSPYIGADGGWDGRFTDEYMGVPGLSRVQAKWTQHNGKEAYNYLRQELNKELDGAKANGIDNLYFISNAKLTPDYIAELIKLNNGRVKNLFVYDREKLESLINRYTWIKHIYFGVAQRPLLAPYSVYQRDSELDLSFDTEMLERLSEIEQVKNFISGPKKILLVHGPQGYGKSHFLLKMAEIIQEQIPGRWQTLFVRPSLRLWEDAIQDEVDLTKKYVLFLDNADLSEDLTKKIVEALRFIPVDNLKLILSCRRPNKGSVENIVDQQRLLDSLVSLELGQLSEQSSVALLLSVSHNKQIKNPERIVKVLGYNPFYIVAHAKLKNGEADPEDIKSKIKHTLETGSLSVLSPLGFNSASIKLLLRELAATVPLKLDETNVVGLIAEAVGVSADLIKQAVEKLVEANIFRYVGSEIRYSSDLNGMIYLSILSEEHGGEAMLQSLITRLLPIIPKKLALNLSSSAVQSNSNENLIEVLNNLLGDINSHINDQADYERSRTLEWIKYIARLVPDQSVELLSRYINSQESPNDISRDNYGPVINEVSCVPGYQEAILNIVSQLVTKKIVGAYSNYEPTELVENAVSPIGTKNLGLSINSLNTLDSWVSDGISNEIADLVLAGVNEALSGSHQYQESYANTISRGRKSLVYSDKVGEFRNVALQVLRKMIFLQNEKAVIKSLELYNQIGHDSNSNNGQFWDRIVADKEAVLGWIEELFANGNPSVAITSEIEEQMLKLWANNDLYPALSVRAETILSKIDRSPEYLIYKLFQRTDFVIHDYVEFIKSAPARERWRWLVYSKYSGYKYEPEPVDSLTKGLSDKYNDPEKIIDYLNSLDSSVASDLGWGHIPLIESWAEHNKDFILSIAKDKGVMAKVPERFRRGFLIVGAQNIENYTNDYAEEIIGSETINPNELVILLDLCSKNNVPVETTMGWIRSILPKLDRRGVSTLMHRAFFLFKDLPEDIRDKVALDFFELVTNQGITVETVDSFDFFVKNIFDWKVQDRHDLTNLREKLFDIVKEMDKLDHHSLDIIALSINGELPKFLHFMDYRLQKAKVQNNFDAIPYSGFPELKGIIKIYDDYKLVMERLVEWNNNELIYISDVGNILNSISAKQDQEHGDFLIYYVKEKLDSATEENVKSAAIFLSHLGISDSTIDIFLDAFQKAGNPDLFDEVRGALSHNVWGGGYSGTVGEPPAPLINKKEILIKMRDKSAPGVIRNQLTDLVKGIENDIENHTKRDAEILDPLG